MIIAEPHPQERQRVASLKTLNLLDSPIEERFERITRLVCRTMDVPIALFNLIDVDRQHYKSTQGVPGGIDADKETSFCTHALHVDKIIHVANTHKDERFFDNPFVTGKYMDIGFYAGCPVRSPDGMPIGTLCAIDRKPRDVSEDQLSALCDLAAIIETELKLSNISDAQATLLEELDKANQLAMVDPLTRLWNRRGIFELLEREWAESIRQENPLTLAVCDIDFFKKINDTAGHAMGDAVLQESAKRLLQGVRGEDAVGRIGDEEFLVLLTNCAIDKAGQTLERLRNSFEAAPLQTQEGPYSITMSYGFISAVPSKTDTFDEWLKHADQALYQAKNDGRNRVVQYDGQS